MITLGGRGFAGPFLAPLRAPVAGPGVFAVLVPGWQLLSFRVLEFGEAADLGAGLLRRHPRFAEWVRAAGTEWNLYVATHAMERSTEAQRAAAVQEVRRAQTLQAAYPAAGELRPQLQSGGRI